MTFFALKRYNFLKLALQTLEQFPDFEQEMEEEKANMKQNVSQIKRVKSEANMSQCNQ